MMQGPTILVILDGLGYRAQREYNAVAYAHTPMMTAWRAAYPYALLQAAGRAVGLPDGFMGNSEVGHMAIGCGRRVKQSITIINEAIEQGSFFKHPCLVSRLEQLKKSGHALHIMGLLSDGGVHSHIDHLFAFIKAADAAHIERVYIHAFLDGRDTPPQSATKYLQMLEKYLTRFPNTHLASMHGRYYAMDRDKNWERTELSYRTLVAAQSGEKRSWRTVLEESYAQGLTDEFVVPVALDPAGCIGEKDGIIFFNFRSDRARQLTESFVVESFNHFPVKHVALSCFITPTEYASMLSTDVLFPAKRIEHTLKEMLADAGKSMFTIAETEKYAHVTYFFAGGNETPFLKETRVLIPSIAAKNYVAHPRMSADEITKTVIASLQNDPHDFYLINYANPDMVGHSGNFQATVKAVECVDEQLAQLFKVGIDQLGGTLVVTGDHGNVELMFDEEHNQPCTSHTTNPVPFFWVSKESMGKKQAPLSELADIAPFILAQLALPIPEEMHKNPR